MSMTRENNRVTVNVPGSGEVEIARFDGTSWDINDKLMRELVSSNGDGQFIDDDLAFYNAMKCELEALIDDTLEGC